MEWFRGERPPAYNPLKKKEKWNQSIQFFSCRNCGEEWMIELIKEREEKKNQPTPPTQPSNAAQAERPAFVWLSCWLAARRNRLVLHSQTQLFSIDCFIHELNKFIHFTINSRKSWFVHSLWLPSSFIEFHLVCLVVFFPLRSSAASSRP